MIIRQVHVEVSRTSRDPCHRVIESERVPLLRQVFRVPFSIKTEQVDHDIILSSIQREVTKLEASDNM